MHLDFETERLWMRPTLPQDAELIYALMNTPKFLQYVGDRNIRSVADAESYIKAKMLPQLDKLGYSSYTLITKVEAVKIGTCGLYDREGVDGIDIGFGFLPAYEGMGYGYEAASRLLTAAFEDFKIQEVKAITSKENIASQKLLEKLGLVLEGTTLLPNEDEEILLYRKVYQLRT